MPRVKLPPYYRSLIDLTRTNRDLGSLEQATLASFASEEKRVDWLINIASIMGREAMRSRLPINIAFLYADKVEGLSVPATGRRGQRGGNLGRGYQLAPLPKYDGFVGGHKGLTSHKIAAGIVQSVTGDPLIALAHARRLTPASNDRQRVIDCRQSPTRVLHWQSDWRPQDPAFRQVMAGRPAGEVLGTLERGLSAFIVANNLEQ